jgi:hypothetical protein
MTQAARVGDDLGSDGDDDGDCGGDSDPDQDPRKRRRQRELHDDLAKREAQHAANLDEPRIDAAHRRGGDEEDRPHAGEGGHGRAHLPREPEDEERYRDQRHRGNRAQGVDGELRGALEWPEEPEDRPDQNTQHRGDDEGLERCREGLGGL